MNVYAARKLVERLHENSLLKSSEAWQRTDGGQDLSIGAALADEAADTIEALIGELSAAETDRDNWRDIANDLMKRQASAS